MRKPMFALAAAAIALMLPAAVSAATFGAGESYTLHDDEAIEGNLYAAGGTVSVLGDVLGDAILAGGNVTVTGEVGEDVAAVGGTVLLLGDVLGDVRVAGGDLTIGGNVGGEVIAAGGIIHVLPGSLISGDIVLVGGEVRFLGTAASDVLIDAESATLGGEIAGHVKADVLRLDVTSGARIAGVLSYTAPTEGVFSPDAELGGIEFTPAHSVRPATPDAVRALERALAAVATAVAVFAVVKLITMLVLAFVATSRFPKTVRAYADDVLDNLGMRILLGFAVAVCTPIVAFLLFLSVIGAGFSWIGMISYALLAVAAGIMTAPMIGIWTVRAWTKRKDRAPDRRSVLLGYALGVAVLFIPVLGALIVLVWYFAALGGLSVMIGRRVSALK